MDRVRDAGRDITFGLEKRNRFEIGWDLIQSDWLQNNGKKPSTGMCPSLFRNAEFGEGIAAGVEGMGTNHKDKELGFFDRLPDPHIIFFARRQVCAVEEHTVSLPAKRKLDRFDEVTVLGRITQEHSHRPMKACTGFSYNTDLCTDFRLWRRNGSGKTLLETDAAGEKIEDRRRAPPRFDTRRMEPKSICSQAG